MNTNRNKACVPKSLYAWLQEVAAGVSIGKNYDSYIVQYDPYSMHRHGYPG